MLVETPPEHPALAKERTQGVAALAFGIWLVSVLLGLWILLNAYEGLSRGPGLLVTPEVFRGFLDGFPVAGLFIGVGVVGIVRSRSRWSRIQRSKSVLERSRI